MRVSPEGAANQRDTRPLTSTDGWPCSSSKISFTGDWLVSSIRSDYQAPDEFGKVVKAEEARKEAEEVDRKARKKAREESDRAQAKEADLKARWEKLPESERESIRASVKADNPGLGRWKNMLEPLCLAALEARTTRPTTRQKALFPAEDED